MHCLFIYRDSQGRLPDAEALRRCGFGVSEAALPQPTPESPRREPAALALAAETIAAYGAKRADGAA
ncbi:hypothetical protein SAMN04488503_3052 [Humidesulfovibrio mexicanus]|uniref:Uncharacterized protein n=1 Tax=Humidesulfovibrio mexicanus TaxID=147047 RepID=A0A239CCJ6_9BACT|nr:hypothetical protein [Humidesulfovibrio mexicanus]SNS17388.1 hypothetical protein SAMN04488503_3052 [Humidesulfovibrio mexicanus]